MTGTTAVQHARTATLPKEAELGDVFRIEHRSGGPLTWEPFCTIWLCTGHDRLTSFAQWQQVQLGEEQLGE
ncbi:hypothetical protein [Streptomyces chattanoogensis]|nr:hypothetical protein [Streptomyces chattanoogensis]